LFEQSLPLRRVRFDAHYVVTGIAEARREGSDAGAEVDQIPGIRSPANQTDQVIGVVVCAFERLEEIAS
jgi:hypothetical protein